MTNAPVAVLFPYACAKQTAYYGCAVQVDRETKGIPMLQHIRAVPWTAMLDIGSFLHSYLLPLTRVGLYSFGLNQTRVVLTGPLQMQ